MILRGYPTKVTHLLPFLRSKDDTHVFEKSLKGTKIF